MSLDFESQRTLGVMAGTLAQYIRDNPEQPTPDEDGVADADEFGMYAMATGFLRLYYELVKLGAIQLPDGEVPSPTHEAPSSPQ